MRGGLRRAVRRGRRLGDLIDRRWSASIEVGGGTLVRDCPQMIVPIDRIEPVPRRVRAVLSRHTVLDTTQALYVWESPNYLQY